MSGCVDRIEISPADYEQLRSRPRRFAVVPGHELLEVEDVVERRDGWLVVRKHEGEPARYAESTDPRSD